MIQKNMEDRLAGIKKNPKKPKQNQKTPSKQSTKKVKTANCCSKLLMGLVFFECAITSFLWVTPMSLRMRLI